MSDQRIRLRPPPTIIFFSIASIAIGVLFAAWVLTRTQELTSFGTVLMGSAIVLFVFAGLDGIQRCYLIEKTTIRKRILFLWKEYRVPSDVEIQTNRAGQVLVKSKTEPRVVVRIPREYNHRNALAGELHAFFVEA